MVRDEDTWQLFECIWSVVAAPLVTVGRCQGTGSVASVKMTHWRRERLGGALSSGCRDTWDTRVLITELTSGIS